MAPAVPFLTSWIRRTAERFRHPSPAIFIAITTTLLAYWATRAILLKTEGVPAVPLDDAFIHFQFSRTFAEFRPFEYSAGSPPVPGATSLLWPLVLAPFHWVGLGGLRIIWVAWALGWLSLGLLAYETWQASQGLLTKESAATATGMVLAFGGYTWFASSGMEVVPLAWLLMRTARRVAEWAENEERSTWRERGELFALAILTSMVRPEGGIAALLAVAVLVWFPRGGSRFWALVPILGPLVPGAVNLLFTGQWMATTAEAKWLLHVPYQHRVPGTLRYHFDVLFNTLLDGRIWSSVFLPRGIKYLVWPALPLLLVAGSMRNRWARALALFVVGLGLFIPTTYDSFLVNRLRYLWPFAAAWFIGVAALADSLGEALAQWDPRLAVSRVLVGGLFVGALAAYQPFTMDDLATSADAIRLQQVAMAKWIDEELPNDAVVGVNDAGAVAYLSKRRTYDLVGLTTLGEARYWAAGPGSRFEHYERVGEKHLPTHLAIYETWLGFDSILGEYLTSMTVTDATILGGTTESAFVARYDELGSAALPVLLTLEGEPLDTLDVADLESEAAHGYHLFWATKETNVVVEDGHGHVDGGRSHRTEDRFVLHASPGGHLVARLAGEPGEVEVLANGHTLGTFSITGADDWEEHRLTLPQHLGGEVSLRVVPSGGQVFTSLHYWTYR